MALITVSGVFYAFSLLSIVTSLLVIAYFLVNEVIRYNARIKGLPGPSGIPVIGNLHQLRGISAAEQYRKWADEYGPVFQVQLGNTPVIVVNSAAAAKELFLGQTSALNSRPIFHVFHKIVSKSVLSIGTSPWDDSCKRRRKAAATTLNRSKTPSYLPILKLESTEFIKDLLQAGDAGKVAFDPEDIIHRLSLNLSLTLNYGTRIKNAKTYQDSPLFAEVIHIETEIGKLRSVGSNFNNYIPALRFVAPLATKLGLSASPAHGADIGRRRIAYNRKLLEELKQRVSEGSDVPCIQSGVLRDPESSSLTEAELLSISFSMMAGAETNTPTIGWAILLLSRRPDIQATAFSAIQAAGVLDKDPFSVVGEVPYISAFTKEILRFYSPLRLALPKATSGIAKWGSAEIPKDTMVFLNAWACNRDPEAYTSPSTFAPERWLIPSEQPIYTSSATSYSTAIPMYNDTPPATSHFSFGYGGRMCVASHVANKALYLVFLHLVGNFKILPDTEMDSPKSSDGSNGPMDKEKDIANFDGDEDIDPLKGIHDISHTRAAPRPFKVKLVPRNEGQLRAAVSNA